MQADVGLQALGEALQQAGRVDAVGVAPRVLEVLLQPLPERVRYLEARENEVRHFSSNLILILT